MMELLLVNHPLDCPMCDKGGECPLQNQAMSTGQGETRFDGEKRTFEKPVASVGPGAAGPRALHLSAPGAPGSPSRSPATRSSSCVDRGPNQQVAIAEGEPFDSYFSGNTVQICPVGALTGAAYRFRARPVRPGVRRPACASTARRAAGSAPTTAAARSPGGWPATTREVNEEWNCDKGRWAFTYTTQPDRLTEPLVRDERPACWCPRVLARGLTGRPRPAALARRPGAGPGC